MKNRIEKNLLDWMKKQVGATDLQEDSLGSLVRGISGRFLQAIAMYVPMTPSMRVTLQRGRGVKIGRDVFIGLEVFIDPAFPEMVTIESYATLAGRNMVLAHTDPPFPIKQTGAFSRKVQPVKIGKGAWVAVGAIILPGVSIGECAVVSAGAVVAKDVPPYTLVGGVPARAIQSLGSAQQSSAGS